MQEAGGGGLTGYRNQRCDQSNHAASGGAEHQLGGSSLFFLACPRRPGPVESTADTGAQVSDTPKWYGHGLSRFSRPGHTQSRAPVTCSLILACPPLWDTCHWSSRHQGGETWPPGADCVSCGAGCKLAALQSESSLQAGERPASCEKPLSPR